MSTQKLRIKRIVAYNAYWYAIIFVGDKDAYSALVTHLKGYTKHGAYWRPNTLADEKGAWIVRSDVLERYADRFEGDLLAEMRRAQDERVKSGRTA